jgi:hypothetical protein
MGETLPLTSVADFARAKAFCGQTVAFASFWYWYGFTVGGGAVSA